jgi:hypothetical protein
MKGFVSAIVASALVALLVVFFRGWRVETFRDQRVRAGDIVTPLSLIAVHMDNPHFLTVFGRTYRRVRGLRPFYLDVPGLDSILFVTGEDDQIFYLVDLKSKKVLRVNADKCGFGGHIGSFRGAGEPYTDFVDSATSNCVVVASQYPDAKKSFYLDFNAGKLQKVVYEKYENQVTNRSVYVDGNRVN